MKGSHSSRLHIDEKNILNKISDEYDGRYDARKMSSFQSAKNLRVDSSRPLKF
jgi:hypothetical protein